MEHIIDATNQKLGRLASEIAVILQGKKNAGYDPRLLGAPKIKVRNFSKIEVTGRKFYDKAYYRHTGYMGHLRKKTYRQIFEKSPEKVLIRAVYNMLPKNRLRAKRMKKLIIEK